MTVDNDTPALDQQSAARLADFARACKAAARAVSLYPPEHPAIRLSMARLVDTAGRMTQGGPVTLGVLPDNVLIDGKAAARSDQAVRETGALLHDHMIGLVKMHDAGTPDAWLPFLLLLARSLDDIRAGGGIARMWAASGHRHLEIQEIDYADILRERSGQASTWDEIVRACLNLDSPLDDETLRQMIETCGDAERFGEFIAALEETEGTGTGSKAAALLRMLRGVVEMVAKTDPAKLEPLMQNISDGLGKISPELMVELLSQDPNRAEAAADLVLDVASRMSDATIGGFVARNVIEEGGATTRLAQAFQALVPDKGRRPAMLEVARSQVAGSPLGESEGFADLWLNTAEMLTSYSDEQYVSEAYARELSGARQQALEVERVSDDPPERIGAWISSVGPAEVRRLDLELLLDLLKIEVDPERWKKMTGPAVGHIEDLLLVGDFQGALQLVTALAVEMEADTPRAPAATSAIDRLVQGSMMWHVTSHLRTVDDETTAQIAQLCRTVGTAVIKPLAEALAVEKRTASRQRLTQLLIGFGAAGRQSVEQLKASANPAVRRTAIYLLREFGGSEALPDLTALLDDAEPHIQREAVRAILAIGTEEAYSELQKALATGTDKARESLVEALIAMRTDRAIPLFEYIVTRIDRRGPLRGVYLRAVESLGALKADTAVDMLKQALYQGEWWAPFRTAELRRTLAAALLQIGTPEAVQVLDEAAERGPRGVRAAIKAIKS